MSLAKRTSLEKIALQAHFSCKLHWTSALRFATLAAWGRKISCVVALMHHPGQSCHGSIACEACGFSEPHLAEVGAEHLAEPALEPCREDSPEITSPVVPFTSLCLAKRVAYRNQWFNSCKILWISSIQSTLKKKHNHLSSTQLEFASSSWCDDL